LAGECHGATRIGPDHRLLRSLQPGPRGPAAIWGTGERLLRRQRPLRSPQLGHSGLQARPEQQPHPHQPAEPGRAEDLSAAPLPGCGDSAGGRRILAVRGQPAAQLQPTGDALMDRRRRSSLAASPLLIGAVTTLIVLVAVYLSYNANNGLPFIPTYNVKVALSEASGLQPTNQVRMAGTRVGSVSSLTPHQDPATGRLTAIANLKLENSVEPLPADTRAIVRSVSSIGLKYLELEKGVSRATLRAGATIPVSQTRESVEIDQLFNTFDKKTRTAIQQNTI